MKNTIQFLDSAQLVKSVLEQTTGRQFNSTLVLINDLTTLSNNQNEVFYFGVLTIGLDTNNQKVVLMPQKLFTDTNFQDKVLFNSLAADNSGVTTYPLTSLDGNFYGYVFTPTKNSSKSISLD